MAMCLTCGEREVSPCIFDANVCNECAEHIANVWWRANTGRYLTYPNEPEPARYKKAVIPTPLRVQVFVRDGGRCVQCGSDEYLHADHVQPESKGGETTLTNLQTLCRQCNTKKGAKWP